MRVASSGSHWELLMGPMKANLLVVQRALSLEKLLGGMRAGQLDRGEELWLAVSLDDPKGIRLVRQMVDKMVAQKALLMGCWWVQLRDQQWVFQMAKHWVQLSGKQMALRRVLPMGMLPVPD
jgi:hypothetical protein